MESLAGKIRGIVFDLDGTLYDCPAFTAETSAAAVSYIAMIKGVDQAEAKAMMASARSRLEEEQGTAQTLSAVCAELGGNIRALHAAFAGNLRPEAFLKRDERVAGLLSSLARSYELYLYTNNNRALSNRILGHLGLEELFRRVFAIDDSWRAKPDEEMLENLLAQTGLAPAEALFVGDRYDIDLRLPEQKGCPVYLSQSIEKLLRLEALVTGWISCPPVIFNSGNSFRQNQG